MTGSLYPPDVTIEVVNTTNSVTILKPRLLTCIIGPCKQLMDALDSEGTISSSASGGTYDGYSTSYDYPGLIDYADVITSSVKVYFRYGNAATLVELDSDEFVAGTDTVTVSAGAQSITGGGTVKVDVYIQYQALRLDLAAYSDYNLYGTSVGTYIESTDDITTYLGPIDIRNPLAVAASLAKQNAPNTGILCIGVDAVTTNMSMGTAEAYTRALEWCETQEVYALVPLSQETSVLSLFPTHVDSMSAITGKKERIAFLNVAMPSTSGNETQASGSYGNVVDSNTFETAGDLSTVSTSDVLLVTGDDTEYVIQSISGTRVDVLPATLSGSGDKTWSIYTPGTAITNRDAIATAYAAIGESYGDKRVFIVVPDMVEASIDGTTQQLAGYYGAACVGGQVGEVKPQQPLSNFPIAGLTGLDGSNDYFTPSQLNTMAGGGLYILTQENSNALVRCRHQLSTDVSTIQYRELSITKSIDYVAKSLRICLRPLVGRNVITSKFINLRVGPAITGLMDDLVTGGIISKYSITSLAQSSDQPDTITVSITVTPIYPCNTIAITIYV